MTKADGNRLKATGNFIKEIPGASIGSAAQNLNYINEKGVAKFMKHTVNKSRTVTKKVNGQNHIFRRSTAGQVANLSLGTTGIAVASGMPGKDVYGKEKSITKRVTGAASWLVAPGLAGTAEVAGMLRPKKNIINKLNGG